MHKPGYKTTEFYLVLATNLAVFISALSDALPPKYATYGAAIVNGLYAIARGLSKWQKLP